MMSEFTPINEIGLGLAGARLPHEGERIKSKLFTYSLEAEVRAQISAPFSEVLVRADGVSTQMQDIQRKALDVLVEHDLKIDDETTMRDIDYGLRVVKEVNQEIAQELERGDWRPNVWRSEIRSNRYDLGFDLLKKASQTKSADARIIDHRQRLLTQIGGRGLGSAGGSGEANKRQVIARCREICQEIEVMSNDPKVLWQVLANKGAIPQPLLDDVEMMNDMMEIYKINREIDTTRLNAWEKSRAKAHALEKFLDRGVNAIFLDEVVDGKFKFDDYFFNTVIEGIAGIESGIKSQQRFDAGRRKPETNPTVLASRRLLLASLATVGILTGNYAFSNGLIKPDTIPTVVATEMQKIPAVAEWLGREVQKIPQNLVDTFTNATKSVPTPAGPREEVKEPTNPKTDDLSVVAKKRGTVRDLESAVGANDFLGASRYVFWRIEGDSAGYYKIDTSSRFVSGQDKGWEIEVDQTPFHYNITADHSDTHFSKTFKATDTGEITIDLPVRDDEFINARDKKVFLDRGSSGGAIDLQTDIFFQHDGTYTMVIKSPEGGFQLGERVVLRVGATKFDKNNMPLELKTLYLQLSQPTSFDKDKYIVYRDFPDDLKKVVDEVRSNQNLTQMQKAQVISEWMRRTFVYSLDGRWDKLYNQETIPYKYFQRIFEIKRVTCDGANSSLVMALRAMGFPARSVSGFRNDGFPLFPSTYELTGNKLHAWVEAYLDTTGNGNYEWVRLDGTPTKMDSTTLETLAKLFAQEGLPISLDLQQYLDAFSNLTIDRLVDETLLNLATLKEMVLLNMAILGPLGVAAVAASYLSGMVGASRMRDSLMSRYTTAERKIKKNFGRLIGGDVSSHSRLLNHVSKMYRTYTRASDMIQPDGCLSFMTAPLNPMTYWKLARGKREVAIIEREIPNMGESRLALDTVSETIARVTGKDSMNVVRDIEARNKNSLLDEMRGRFEDAIQQNMGFGEGWRIKVDRTVKTTETFEQFYKSLTASMYREFRSGVKDYNKSRGEGEEEYVVPNLPEEELLARYRQNLQTDLLRSAYVYWKYAKLS